MGKAKLTVEEARQRCEKCGIEFISLRHDDEQGRLVIDAKCQCGDLIKGIIPKDLNRYITNGKIRLCKKCGRQKANESLKGRERTEKQMESVKKPKTEEHKRKISETLKGTKLSEETKRKISEAEKGSKHHNWQGGISLIRDYLRKFTVKWDKEVRKAHDNKCSLTGNKCTTRNSTVHHLYSFSNIVRDAHIYNNIEIKPQVKDYTEEELKLLEEYVTEWHEKNIDKGVLILKTVHKQFHVNYMGGYNKVTTEKDFLEFAKQFNKENTNVA